MTIDENFKFTDELFDLQISDDIPDARQPTPERSAIEQLFMDIAGPSQEIGWMELKRILGNYEVFSRVKVSIWNEKHKKS